MSEECGSCEYNRQCFVKKNVGIFECEKEIVNSEDMQFYEYLGLLEQVYYDTHVGSKAGVIISETIKSYVNILKYKNNKLQQKVEQLEKENKKLKEENKRIFQNVNDDELLISNAMNYAELKKAEKKVEQLENIRKEAIELIWGRAYLGEETGEGDLVDWAWLSDNDIEDLLNILNKGSEE